MSTNALVTWILKKHTHTHTHNYHLKNEPWSLPVSCPTQTLPPNSPQKPKQGQFLRLAGVGQMCLFFRGHHLHLSPVGVGVPQKKHQHQCLLKKEKRKTFLEKVPEKRGLSPHTAQLTSSWLGARRQGTPSALSEGCVQIQIQIPSTTNEGYSANSPGTSIGSICVLVFL